MTPITKAQTASQVQSAWVMELSGLLNGPPKKVTLMSQGFWRGAKPLTLAAL
jgi:hypothetical protein